MSNLVSNFGVGWDASAQEHSAIRAKNIVLGKAMAGALSLANEEMRRFASTVLDAIGFTDGALEEKNTSIGNASIHSSGTPFKDIDFVHRKFKSDIYSKHLVKPFMGNDELSNFLVGQVLDDNGEREYMDLLSKDVDKAFGIKL